MPRVLLTVSLIAWRVPNETSIESVTRIWAEEISAIAAASAGSRVSPIVTSDCAMIDEGCCAANPGTKSRKAARRRAAA